MADPCVLAWRSSGLPRLRKLFCVAYAAPCQVANPRKPACGTVIEANLDRKRGPVATLLVQVRA